MADEEPSVETEELVEEVVEETLPEETEEEQPLTVEDLAGDMGWRPQDQWKGDPTSWKPAHEFVKSTVDVNGRLKNSLRSVEQQMAAMAKTQAVITERAVANERQKLLDERQQAFEVGDAEKFTQVDKQLSELKAPEVPQVQAPEVQDFVERNATWFNKDPEATTWAQTRAGELANQGFGPARQLAIVEREAKQYFPEFFEQARPAAKSVPLSKPGNRGGTVAAKGFAALPKDAQAAALDYERRGVCKKEEYAKTYWEDN